MKSKLFGSRINPDCTYCEYSVRERGALGCAKGKTPRDGSCRKFKYDPLMRVPASITLKGNYSADDFKL